MMKVKSFLWRTASLAVILVIALVAFSAVAAATPDNAPSAQAPDVAALAFEGPIVGDQTTPLVFEGSLIDLPVGIPSTTQREVPLGITGLALPTKAGPVDSPEALEATLQSIMPDAVTPAEFLNPNPNFDGISGTGFVPPDTNGDVGPNHYIQMVNSQFQIWNKQGVSQAGPTAINQIWVAAGDTGACATNNNGDPIVMYDHLADRWVLTQFAVPNGFANPPTWECVAVSRTADPVNGGWNLYTFQWNFGHDYPKLGVWADAYYLTSQRGYPGGALNLIALDRANMLNGNPVTPQTFSVGSPAIVFLPADLDGPPPPAGTPGLFARMLDGGLWGGNDRVEIYELDIDWGVPANSTLSPPITLNTAAFDSGLCSPASLFENCIPQPNTNQLVAGITVWPMFRLQYRNFGSHEAMVFNHTVDADGNGNAGIRWYELRRTGGVWSIFQQGTFAPQPVGATSFIHRWMGSIAMDRTGNIALGYSASNSTDVFPAVRYAGRLATDPLGILPHGEVVMQAGTGSQTGSSRWGDYSAMTVDPVDDCTFWYTQEYIPANGFWQTRIGAFRFDNCGPDLSISKTDSPDPVIAGELLRYDITVTNHGPTVATNVQVVDTLPAGVTYVTGPAYCTTLGNVVTCDLGDLAAGATQNFSLQVEVAASAGSTTITNTAVVSSDQSDPDESNNTSVADTLVIGLANLEVFKECKPDLPGTPLYAGQTGICTIRVHNWGPGAANNVVLTDVHTAGTGVFSFGTVTPSQGVCNVPANPQNGSATITCSLGTLATGAEATVTVEVTAAEGMDVNDTARAVGAEADPNIANNSASDGLTFVASANLALTKTAAASVIAGTNLTYDLSVTNNGPSTAVNVVVDDVLPAGVTIISVSSSGGTCNTGIPGNPGQPTSCTFDSMAPAAVETMQIVVRVDPSVLGVLGNNAVVSADTYDPDNSNNLATTATTVAGSADLLVVKTDYPDPVLAGNVLTYDVKVTNNGPSTAVDPILTDVLPAQVTFLGYQVSNGTGTCSLLLGSTHDLSCDLNDLLPNQFVRVVFTVRVDPTTPHGTNITNTATVTAATADPDLTNNTATAGTLVNAAADLVITKDASVNVSNPAPRVTYTIRVVNSGPSDALAVVMQDDLPLTNKKIVYVFDTGNGACTYYPAAPHKVICNVGTLQAGASWTVDIIVDVRGSVRVISNYASVTSTTSDPNLANNTVRKDVRIKGGPGN